MDKAFEIQRQARDNVKTLQTYLTDLQNWEVEMKRKEAALNGELEQDLPPVRSKVRKEKPVQVNKEAGKRIRASDYGAWEKFDVDKACEEVDMAEVGPVSLDSKKSQSVKMEKLREEAQYEKERGNNFVKQEKWDDAIACYNRAIELVKDDAIYYANRGLCHLKKESLHQAETDCTEALRLDPTYVKALQRRATAREKLGSLRAASHDLNEVIKLEPHNAAARRQLNAIKARMGTKGAKSKSSPTSTPTSESNPISKTKGHPKIIEIQDSSVELVKELSPLEKWRDGIGEDVTVIKPVKKPPHLRSKRALKHVPIQEILLGRTIVEKPATRLKIIEIEDNQAHGDSNNNDSNKISQKSDIHYDHDIGHGDQSVGHADKSEVNNEFAKVSDLSEKVVANMVPPVNSVQFILEWKGLRGNDAARSDYLSIIEPSKLPSIFENALESDVLSEVLQTLHNNRDKFKDKTIGEYLKNLCRVKRFSALAMFLSNTDKELLNSMLSHCKEVEHISDSELMELKNKYEL
ncbi:RNA polymerase II-associated protein 3-like isoform X1 [Maniola jurtina]|uniref:RNA polymerase II-associated protein 3-like isoform X1 n=2 Tax=Maniola jurtina TaxID=191418 RepID=UPI001E686C67|nr:RNA polymerase II-associated protein 3-like isoform X1 [Maniola jurtina]